METLMGMSELDATSHGAIVMKQRLHYGDVDGNERTCMTKLCPFSILHSPFSILHSPFTIHHFTIHHSPFTISPFTIHHSPFTHSPFHHSPFNLLSILAPAVQSIGRMIHNDNYPSGVTYLVVYCIYVRSR